MNENKSGTLWLIGIFILASIFKQAGILQIGWGWILAPILVPLLVVWFVLFMIVVFCGICWAFDI